METTTTPTLDEKLTDLFASEPWAVNARVEILRELRETAPVYRFGSTVLVTAYEDIREVLGDPERFSNQHHNRGSRAEAARGRLNTDDERRAFDEVMVFESHFMNRNDSEAHARLRGVSHRAFTPGRIRELEEQMAVHAEEIVGGLPENETVDMASVVSQLPLMVICDMIGVPLPDRHLVGGWANTLAHNRYGQAAGPLVAAHGAWLEFRSYISDLIERHRETPGAGGPLVNALLDAAEGEILTEDEIKSLFVMLLEGGFETTSNLIGIGLYSILSEPGEWEALVDDPSLIPNTVEEMIRVVSPAAFTSRRALVPVELHGMQIEAETTIVSSNASANRDPMTFEDPDCCRVARPEARRHVGFGHGPHFCLGAALARSEARTALEKLVAAFPRLELATDRVEFTGSSSLRRLVDLPVALGPRGG